MFFAGHPSVYMHCDETWYKTLNYVRFVPLGESQVFWAAAWEVRGDRSDRVPKKGAD